MTATSLKALVFSWLTFLTSGAEINSWKAASAQDRGIQVLLSQQAMNSCEVDFRDLNLKNRTSLTATIGYLPHKGSRNSMKTDVARLVVSREQASSEHIVPCERVLSVTVSGVSRE
jgi:hypothetical protein